MKKHKPLEDDLDSSIFISEEHGIIQIGVSLTCEIGVPRTSVNPETSINIMAAQISLTVAGYMNLSVANDLAPALQRVIRAHLEKSPLHVADASYLPAPRLFQ